MASVIMDQLRTTLDNLSRDDFKRFRHMLDERSKIPWRNLEKADTEDVLRLMTKEYGSVEKCGVAMVNILRTMNHNHLATELEEHLLRLTGKSEENNRAEAKCQATGCGADTHEKTKALIKQKLKTELIRRFLTVHKELEDCVVQEIYTELLIVKGFSGGVNAKHEVTTIGMRQIKQEDNQNQVKLETMFKTTTTKVLTLGIAGVGKTVAVQKFVLDWAEGQTNQDIHFVFVFLFRELNLKGQKPWSFFDLLLHFYPSLRDCFAFPEFSGCRSLYIFDGLDESQLQLDFGNWITDPNETSSLDVVISSVIKGMLLPSALLWVTSRPAAAHLVPRECFQLVTEVLGFSDQHKEIFFQKNMKDEKKARNIVSHLKRNKSLDIMCYLPVFCHILATLSDEILGDLTKGMSLPTLTEIYTSYIFSQITKMNDRLLLTQRMNKEQRGQFILKLGKLALHELQKENYVFYISLLQEFGIDVNSSALQSGVFTQIFTKESTTTGESIYTFVHLTVQEYLAALFALSEILQKRNPFPMTVTEKIINLFYNSTYDLYILILEKSLQSPNGHLDLLVRFLVGFAPMLAPEIKPALKGVLPRCDVRGQIVEKITLYIKERITIALSTEQIFNLLFCQFELGDITATERIDSMINKRQRLQVALAVLIARIGDDLDHEVRPPRSSPRTGSSSSMVMAGDFVDGGTPV